MRRNSREIPDVKMLTADGYKRVRIPDCKPRQVFSYKNENGTVTLTPVVEVRSPQRPSKVRFEKRGGRTVAFTDHPVSLEAIQEALADFPP